MSETNANSQIWRRYMTRVRERVQIFTGNHKTNGQLRRAALYERISIEEQQEGYSIQEQSIANRQFAEHKGWVVVGEYVDEGYSGTNDRRPAFRTLLSDARRKRFDVVIVKANYDGVKRNFSYEEASPLEKMLIDTVALAWVRLQQVEQYFSNIVTKSSTSIPLADHYDRLLSAAQRRFLRTVETYARVRKLTLSIMQREKKIASETKESSLRTIAG